ncbi:MAG: UTP--glucose-1-phosphate uridylyltransferase [Candidatus Spechtbacteria bacterium SB0662_bin_43]|uniref:UTP--glucose-1-phosphate uridylyltransferase n=1 Tax=Candidatus Spechtbacteria bacterium SB0662_bin_43 TaxID=2604897 RepID=A0A845DCA8_9BACT|nr:UTP--glucose-1-phosphate uridylyltransferase [Candidatus Spechtbacteria bacterium SB0662_bin_43]
MKKITKAVIPVAGKGTRFLPATKAHPKEMLTLVDRPVIHHIVEEAYHAGIKEILFVTNEEKGAIKDHFTRNTALETFLKDKGKHEMIENINTFHNAISFHYVHQHTPNGSGDAVLYAKEFVGEEPFAVFYADDILHCPESTPALTQLVQAYELLAQETASLCSVISIPTKDTHRYGIIQGEQREDELWHVREIVEKPKGKAPTNLASVGRFILNHTIFPLIQKSEPLHNEIYLATALNLLAHTGNLYGYTVSGEWYDCGSKQGLWHANIAMGLHHPDIQHSARDILRSFQDKP